MDRPPPDPAKLLEAWMEWEHGDVTPGRVMATLKTGGLRQLLEAAAAAAAAAAASAPAQPPSPSGDSPAAAEDASTDTWTPVV
jgi:ribosomal protein L12E/L44/L45/RPP1/RPP2